MIFKEFRVFNYRNIHDSGPIDVNEITAFVGQNEAGKSNLFEALYRINPFDEHAIYNMQEDWPVDKWGDQDDEAKVCEATFYLDSDEIVSLFNAAGKSLVSEEGAMEETTSRVLLPDNVTLLGTGYYKYAPTFLVDSSVQDLLDHQKVQKWAKENVPKFVYIHDYEMSGAQLELDNLYKRSTSVEWDQLTADEQTMIVVLDLAKIDLKTFLEKGSTPDGRTTRAFDKRSASAYLSKQFQNLWRQKDVKFDIEIDATTLNIFAQDEELGMPVRLNRRSTGFRWYVAFAWKFTHASKGEFKNCILLLEEPGIHLHYSAQYDLLNVFERLKDSNTILYTTHLASMVDLAYPERIRIVENIDEYATVKKGVVSSQKSPMAVIETCLGLTGNMSKLLGNRKTLIVEGGDDALIIHKLSGMLRSSNKESLSDAVYLWAANGASKTPMYAAFAIGQKWRSGVLLNTDEAGHDAKGKIDDLYLSKPSEEDENTFRVLMLGKAAGIGKTEAAIEDIFPDDFYIELVNDVYGINIKMEDLPVDGSDMITRRVDAVLKSNYSYPGLDKDRVLAKMLQHFDTWHKADDLPEGTVKKAEKLFNAINNAFGEIYDEGLHIATKPATADQLEQLINYRIEASN